MAVFSSQKLIGLRVITESGENIGRVADCDIDADNQKISVYYVSPDRFFSGLFGDNLMIRPDQVVSISEEQMTVEDSAVKEKKSAAAGQPA